MKSLNKLQIALIGFSVLLFVLLYFASKTPETKIVSTVEDKISSKELISFESLLKSSFVNFSDVEKKKITELTSNLTIEHTDSLIKILNELKQPALVAYYSEKKAELTKSSDDFLVAGNRYYSSVRFLSSKQDVDLVYKSAIRVFSKVVEMDPNNTAAKIKLASCMVEGTDDPMKGISLLKEVEKTDSNNVDLQLAFAAFSTKSGQLDKAIMRFNKVLKLKPDYIEAYLYLADAYEKKGDKQNAILSLSSYSSKIEDEGVKKEINKYIEQIKNN